MNAWDNIKAAQIAHDLIYQERSSESIIDFDLSCIYCIKNNKPRTRNYKNFIIYLTNHYWLTDVTDKINLTFKKFSRKIKILIQENEKDDNRDIVKSARKDAKEIFETVRFSKISETSLKNIASILIGVAFRIGVFGDANNIEIAH